MKTFVCWNVEAKKNEAEITEVMNKEVSGEPYKFAIVNG